jgi:hypothetical protein
MRVVLGARTRGASIRAEPRGKTLEVTTFKGDNARTI